MFAVEKERPDGTATRWLACNVRVARLVGYGSVPLSCRYVGGAVLR